MKSALHCLAPLLLFLILSSGCQGVGKVLESPFPKRADLFPIPKVFALENLESFDELMTQFIVDQNVPGAAIAVAYKGRLLFAGGYGWAEKDVPVKPTSLFRIASISKPITASVICKLVEEGKLTLDQPILKTVPKASNLDSFDSRWEQITLTHLMQHTGGFDRSASFDPMFRAVEIANHFKIKPPAQPQHVIEYIQNRPLDFTPGERYAYSNFGYCMLGRTIEKITGKSYFLAMDELLLKPLGIRNMHLGKSQLQDRQEGEVRYFGEAKNPTTVFGSERTPTYPSYGTWNLEAMDAHGGWIANAIDLVRFSSHFGPHSQSPYLGEKLHKEMFSPPKGSAGHLEDGKAKDVYYGLGWMVRKQKNGFNFWHSGSLDGTSTILVSRHDGWTWAVLFNKRHGKETVLSRAIDSLVHRAANKVKVIPEGDLFPQFGY